MENALLKAPNSIEDDVMTIAPFDMPHPGRNSITKFPGYNLPKGGICVITGPNGAGKTTILNFLHYNPHLLKNSKAINIVLLDQLYERLLYPYKPVWWNLALPRIIADSLSQVDARKLTLDKFRSFDLDLDPDRYPNDLSGGEMHLLLLLRMSLCDHNVLLLDEPAAAVDISRVNLLWKMVKYLAQEAGKFVILTTHREFPPWAQENPITFAGIRGSSLCVETLIPTTIN